MLYEYDKNGCIWKEEWRSKLRENSESNMELPEERKKERKHLEKKEWRYRVRVHESEIEGQIWDKENEWREEEWSSEGGNEDKVKERRKRENIKKGKGNREVRKDSLYLFLVFFFYSSKR